MKRSLLLLCVFALSVNMHAQAPIANFSAQVDSSCGPTSWKWYFPGATPDTSTLRNPTNIQYNGYGCYAVKLVVKNNNGSDSLTDSNFICLDVPPQITITGDSDICQGQQETIIISGGNQYRWSTGQTTSCINITGIISKTYTVQVSSGRCFKDTTFTVQVDTCLGISSISNQPQISIYPNPTSSFLSINMDEPLSKPSYLYILDITGRRLITQEINSSQFNMNVSSLSPGIYFVKLQTSKGMVVKKFVKD